MRRIERAYGDQKKIPQSSLKHEPVAGVKRLLNRDCRGLREDDVHLLQDFLVVDKCDFLVRQGQFADEVAAERLFGLDDLQIACHEQETVDRRRIVADLRVDYAGVDVGCDGFPLNQQVQLVVHAIVRGRQNLADHGIAAGRLPVGARLAFVAEVVDDRPRIEDVGIAEAVAVVPFADLLILVVGAVVMRHGLDLLVREAEVFAVAVVEDGVDLRVVQAAENAFLGDFEDPGQESERQMAVVLESA